MDSGNKGAIEIIRRNWKHISVCEVNIAELMNLTTQFTKHAYSLIYQHTTPTA